MTDIIKIPEFELTIRPIKNSDKLPTIVDKSNWNFDQFLNLYNKLKFILTVQGERGIPGASRVGSKGDDGQRGTRIFFDDRIINDGDNVTDPNILEGDVVIDSQSNYFTIIKDSNENLIYRFSFNISTVSVDTYILSWTDFQNISSTQIIQRFGISSSIPTDFLLLMARKTNNDEHAEFYKLGVGIENNPNNSPTSLTICNIIDDVDGTTQTAPENFFQIGFKYRRRSNLLPTSFTGGIQYTEINDTTPLLSIKNTIGKIDIVSDTVNNDNSYIGFNTPEVVFWGNDQTNSQNNFLKIGVGDNESLISTSGNLHVTGNTGSSMSIGGYSSLLWETLNQISFIDLENIDINKDVNINSGNDSHVNLNVKTDFNKTANYTKGTGSINNVDNINNYYQLELNNDGNYFEMDFQQNNPLNIVSISLTSSEVGSMIYIKINNINQNINIIKNGFQTNYIIGTPNNPDDTVTPDDSVVFMFMRAINPTNQELCWWYCGIPFESNYKGIKIVSNIAERNSLSAWNGREVHVLDASADLGHSGYAGYVYDSNNWLLQYDSRNGGTTITQNISTRNLLSPWQGRTAHVLDASADLGHSGYAGYIYNNGSWLLQYDSKFGSATLTQNISTRNLLSAWNGREVHVLDASADLGHSGYAGYIYNNGSWIKQYDSRPKGTIVVNNISERNLLTISSGLTVHVLDASADLGYTGYAGYVYSSGTGWITTYVQNTPLDTFFVSQVTQYAGNTDPNAKWMICNGRTLNKTQYSDLWNVIGDTYAPGTGQLVLPNFAGRAAVGTGTLTDNNGISRFILVGSTFGQYSYIMNTSSVPVHNHQIGGLVGRWVADTPNQSGQVAGIDSGGGGFDVGLYNAPTSTNNTIFNPPSPYQVGNPVLGINYIIRVLP